MTRCGKRRAIMPAIFAPTATTKSEETTMANTTQHRIAAELRQEVARLANLIKSANLKLA